MGDSGPSSFSLMVKGTFSCSPEEGDSLLVPSGSSVFQPDLALILATSPQLGCPGLGGPHTC